MFVSTAAEAVNVTVPPLGKLNGYRSAFSFANPAHASAPAGCVYVVPSITAPPNDPVN